MFNFLLWDLKSLKAGQIVEINVATTVNLKLLTYTNFNLYKIGGRYRFFGGIAKQATETIVVPFDGDWVLVADLVEPFENSFGNFRVNSVVVKAPANSSKIEERELTNDSKQDSAEEVKEVYDVFLSHASEDYKHITEQLYKELTDLDLKVWIDRSNQDSLAANGLRQEIDSAIYGSKYSVIILSTSYMVKPWTNREFDGLCTMELARLQTLLYIWHNVSFYDVLKFSPPAANKFARETSKESAKEIATAINKIIKASSNSINN